MKSSNHDGSEAKTESNVPDNAVPKSPANIHLSPQVHKIWNAQIIVLKHEMQKSGQKWSLSTTRSSEIAKAAKFGRFCAKNSFDQDAKVTKFGHFYIAAPESANRE